MAVSLIIFPFPFPADIAPRIAEAFAKFMHALLGVYMCVLWVLPCCPLETHRIIGGSGQSVCRSTGNTFLERRLSGGQW